MAVRSQREPHPALLGLLDAPLKLELSDEVTERINTLRGQVRSAGEGFEWLPLYGDAISVTQLLLADLDGHLGAMERRAMELPDPGAIRQKQLVAPQKQSEEVRTRIRSELTRTTQEWQDRLKRQQAQVERQCLEMLDEHFDVDVAAAKRSVTVTVESRSWNKLLGFIEECSQAWSVQACQNADEQLIEVLALRKEAYGAETVPWSPSPTPVVPDLNASTMRLPQPWQGEAPTTLGALGQFLRSNVMLVSMFGMMLGAPIAILFGVDLGGGRSGMMRGLVVVGALPVLTLIGVYAGRTKRRQTIERIGHEGRTKLRAAIVRSVTSLLSAHRDHNVRWVRARCTELENSLSEWWKIAVVPALGKVEEEVNAQAHSAKIDQRRLSDEHSKLKRTRDDVAGKLLFDLKRHHRELSEQSSGD